MNVVTELVTEASNKLRRLAVRQEGLRQVGGAELILRPDAKHIAPAVEEVPTPVAPVPADACSAGSDARASEHPEDDAVRALHGSRDLGPPGECERPYRQPSPGPHERRSRDAQVAERVVD